MKTFTNLFTILLFLLIGTSLSYAQNDCTFQTLEDLQDSIQKILIETKTPGVGIVMVSGEEIVCLEGMGKADIENNIDVNENTMFRLGSVSKLFVGLAILKLQEEGSLHLNDNVRDWLPDLEIINPWEDEYPLRIVHLLEYTSGFNDWSLAELGSNDPKPKTLRESLDYYPKGRVIKFAPGTRIQYSNLGVSIAAYIVETVSGMTYENYVNKHFFKPMAMENMTFRNTEQYKKTGAKGYDNETPMPYWHVLYRPSAALTGSPKELANLLKFFINRGKINNTQIISDSSLQRMERNESLRFDNSNVFKGQGLTNHASYYKGFVYRGHGGSVPGSNSDFCYLPKYNLGYAVMINGNDQNVLDKISNLVKEYQTKDLPHEIAEHKKAIHQSSVDLSGFYMGVNAKFEAIKFFKKIKSIQKIWHLDDTLFVKPVLNQFPHKFYPSENNTFVSERSDRIVIFQTNDPVEGEVIYGSLGLLKKISPIYAYTLLTIFFAGLIIPITIIIFAFLRLLIYLFGKKKDKVALWISLWPLVTISFIIISVISLFMSIQNKTDAFSLLGNISPLSILIFICTSCFALSSLWSLYYIFKNRNSDISKIFYYHSVLAAIINLVFVIYFLNNGLIGIQTWT